jgi:hypothetical protein
MCLFSPKTRKQEACVLKKKKEEERILQKGLCSMQVCACFHPKQEAYISSTKEWCSGRTVAT